MIVAVHIPDLPLRVALIVARRAGDLPVALGPQPGAPQVIGECTHAAAAMGVTAGLPLGEALARCPELTLVAPDPDAVTRAIERVTSGLEAIGAEVEALPGTGPWCFAADGLGRLHGGLAGVLRRARAGVWVGADPRLGGAEGRFTALQAAREAPAREPLIIHPGNERAFLAGLPIDRLPLDRHALKALRALGIDRIGRLAELPRRAVLDRFGHDGLRAWALAHGEDTQPVRPRTPPEPLEATMRFQDSIGALPALEDAAKMLLRELAAEALARSRALRSLVIRAGLESGGSFAHAITLREATSSVDRLATATLPHLSKIVAPVEWLTIAADASGALDGHQLALITAGNHERNLRTEEAARQVQSTRGKHALLHLIELEPWSQLPERRWALVPFTGSRHPAPSM